MGPTPLRGSACRVLPAGLSCPAARSPVRTHLPLASVVDRLRPPPRCGRRRPVSACHAHSVTGHGRMPPVLRSPGRRTAGVSPRWQLLRKHSFPGLRSRLGPPHRPAPHSEPPRLTITHRQHCGTAGSAVRHLLPLARASAAAGHRRHHRVPACTFRPLAPPGTSSSAASGRACARLDAQRCYLGPLATSASRQNSSLAM